MFSSRRKQSADLLPTKAERETQPRRNTATESCTRHRRGDLRGYHTTRNDARLAFASGAKVSMPAVASVNTIKQIDWKIAFTVLAAISFRVVFSALSSSLFQFLCTIIFKTFSLFVSCLQSYDGTCARSRVVTKRSQRVKVHVDQKPQTPIQQNHSETLETLVKAGLTPPRIENKHGLKEGSEKTSADCHQAEDLEDTGIHTVRITMVRKLWRTRFLSVPTIVFQQALLKQHYRLWILPFCKGLIASKYFPYVSKSLFLPFVPFVRRRNPPSVRQW